MCWNSLESMDKIHKNIAKVLGSHLMLSMVLAKVLGMNPSTPADEIHIATTAPNTKCEHIPSF